MIILRDKNFSLFDKLTSLFKSGKKKTNTNNDNAEIQQEPENTEIKAGEITFKEIYDNETYPSLISIGISCVDPVKEWDTMNNWMQRSGFIKNGRVEEVYKLSDNVKGVNGITVFYIIFTPGTTIDSVRRLQFAETFKWTEDFTDLNNSYHTWYKTSKNIKL